jgi:hypothetical protein
MVIGRLGKSCAAAGKVVASKSSDATAQRSSNEMAVRRVAS